MLGTTRHTTPVDYVRAAFGQFFLHTDRRHPALTLETPTGTVSGLHLAIVANTAPWTFLGDRPLQTSPEASFETGLDLYALTRLRTVGTLGEVSRLLRGRPTPDRRSPRTLVHREHDLGSLTLRSTRPVAAQVDGEALGDFTELDFRSVPDALNVVVWPGRHRCRRVPGVPRTAYRRRSEPCDGHHTVVTKPTHSGPKRCEENLAPAPVVCQG